MDCLGQFINDRICQLCQKVDSDCYEHCKERKFEQSQMTQYLFLIAQECPHRKVCWDEYNEYDGCMKNGWSRYPPLCKPSVECRKE